MRTTFLFISFILWSLNFQLPNTSLVKKSSEFCSNAYIRLTTRFTNNIFINIVTIYANINRNIWPLYVLKHKKYIRIERKLSKWKDTRITYYKGRVRVGSRHYVSIHSFSRRINVKFAAGGAFTLICSYPWPKRNNLTILFPIAPTGLVEHGNNEHRYLPFMFFYFLFSQFLFLLLKLYILLNITDFEFDSRPRLTFV